MADFQESSQLSLWTYEKPEHLEWIRARANLLARQSLVPSATARVAPDPTEAHFFARGWTERFRQGKEKKDDDDEAATTTTYEAYATEGPMENDKHKAFLTAAEEMSLVAWYAPKLATLIGPKAAVNRLKRNSKVTATAVLLYRRFFLSNSVMYYDPKAIMVAAAFLASKVEDASADLRHLEEGTQMMQAHVTTDEILAAELALIQGIAFDLLCFHPYKAVLSLTEDLRTFLKSDKGKALVSRPVSGQDLNPLYTQARGILEDSILHTDTALMYTPGQIGLASLMVAQDVLHEKAAAAAAQDNNNADNNNPPLPTPLEIDWYGYVQHRFEASKAKDTTWQALQALRVVLRQPKPVHDLAQLKAINKKLKKVRAWGVTSDASGSSNDKRKKGTDGGDETTKGKKRVKTEN